MHDTAYLYLLCDSLLGIEIKYYFTPTNIFILAHECDVILDNASNFVYTKSLTS